MDDKYRQLIEDMAAKLGVTAEHLWGVMVKQAPISGAVDLVICIAITVATVWWFRVVIRKTTRRSDDPDTYLSPRSEWNDEAAFLAWVSAIVSMAVTLIFISASAEGIVSAFVNPEYWALQKLLKC